MSNTPTNGKIGVTSENIFPIIKKFLYSEHDIFLRELVSNAVDAISKLQTIARTQSEDILLKDLAVKVSIDEKSKTLSVEDNGVGMTAEEIDRYINQIAFSGAEDFLKKYDSPESQIIGHFGLGFYSAFIVANKVEIDSLSYKKDSKPVHWTCNGSPEFELSTGSRTERGTTITLHLSNDSEKYLQRNEVEGLLKKYCRFMPVPVIFGKKQEWKEGKMQDTEEDNIINNVKPLWMETPASLKEEDYLNFYRELYPGSDDPLFYIHLNVDYPFSLRGILYFPLIKETIDPQRNKIHLYCNQVFVTDQVEGVVPEWLYLLEGIIDSPDIPLNVSRSYLQQDANARKITAHIGKKVADALADLYKNDRPSYEEKWKGIGLFVEYGMLTDEKAYERLKPAMLLKDTAGKLYTLDEYKALVGANQTDKDETLVFLYATNAKDQYLPVQNAIKAGYNVLLMDGPLAMPFVNMLESKEEKLRFARVDSDSLSHLIPKKMEEDEGKKLEHADLLQSLFATSQPSLDKKIFTVELDPLLTKEDAPTQIVSNEWMRRMKEMSRFQSGASFYGELPDSYVLKINVHHPLIQTILDSASVSLGKDYDEKNDDLKQLEEKRKKLVESFEGKSEEDLSEEQKKQRKELTDSIDQLNEDKEKLVQGYVKDHKDCGSLWDIALLSSGLLSGERLHDFIQQCETSLLNKITSEKGK